MVIVSDERTMAIDGDDDLTQKRTLSAGCTPRAC